MGLKHSLQWLMAMATVSLLAGGASAVTLVSENFTVGARTVNPAWYKVGYQQDFDISVVDGSAGIGDGNAMLLDVHPLTTGGATFAHLHFNELTLDDPGEYVQAEFDLRYVAMDADTTAKQGAFAFGFFDTNGTTPVADGVNWSGATDTDDGYGYFVQLDAETKLGSSAEFRRARPNMGHFNTSWSVDQFGASSDNAFVLTPGVYHAVYRIESVLTGGNPDFQVTCSFGSASVSVLVSSKFATLDTTTFGDFNIGSQMHAALEDDIVIDNFEISTNVLHAGDANGDGMVNLADLQILGDNWQFTNAGWAEADFTGDGTVNLADLQILGDNWGFGVGSDVSFEEALAGVVIPEPTCLGLMGLGVILALGRRR